MGKVSLQVAMKRVLAMNAAAKYRYEATIRKNHDLLEFLSASHLVVGGRGYVCDCIRALPVEAQRKQIQEGSGGRRGAAELSVPAGHRRLEAPWPTPYGSIMPRPI